MQIDQDGPTVLQEHVALTGRIKMYEMYSLCIAEQVLVRDFRIRAFAFVLCIPHSLL